METSTAETPDRPQAQEAPLAASLIQQRAELEKHTKYVIASLLKEREDNKNQHAMRDAEITDQLKALGHKSRTGPRGPRVKANGDASAPATEPAKRKKASGKA